MPAPSPGPFAGGVPSQPAPPTAEPFNPAPFASSHSGSVPATPPPPSATSQDTHNISSAKQEDAEVAGVAAELRSNLKGAHKNDQTAAQNHTGEISLGKKHPHTNQLEDTIFIDKEGNVSSD